METFFVNCVMSNWLTITLLELCIIIFNTGMYALAWRLAKAKCQSCHVIDYNLSLRSAILSALSIALNEDPGISRLFSKLSACL